jgi:hypothetical protein
MELMRLVQSKCARLLVRGVVCALSYLPPVCTRRFVAVDEGSTRSRRSSFWRIRATWVFAGRAAEDELFVDSGFDIPAETPGPTTTIGLNST